MGPSVELRDDEIADISLRPKECSYAASAPSSATADWNTAGAGRSTAVDESERDADGRPALRPVSEADVRGGLTVETRRRPALGR